MRGHGDGDRGRRVAEVGHLRQQPNAGRHGVDQGCDGTRRRENLPSVMLRARATISPIGTVA